MGAFLEKIASVLDGGPTMISYEALDRANASFVAAVRIDPVHIQEYADHYCTRNIYYARYSPPAGTVAYSQMMIDDNEFEKHEYTADWVGRKLGMFHVGGSWIFKDARSQATLSMFRVKKRPFGEKEMDVFRRLSPHLQRAWSIHKRFISMQHARDSFSDAADRFPTSIFFLDREGKVVERNRAAVDLVARGDGISILTDGTGRLQTLGTTLSCGD